MDAAFCVHRADDAQFIREPREVWEKFAYLGSALSVFLKLEAGALEFAAEASHAGSRLSGRLLVVFENLVHLAVVVFFQCGLGVEGIHLGGAALGKDVDHPLRLCRKMRRTCVEGRLCAQQAALQQEGEQPQSSHAKAGL